MQLFRSIDIYIHTKTLKQDTTKQDTDPSSRHALQENGPPDKMTYEIRHIKSKLRFIVSAGISSMAEVWD